MASFAFAMIEIIANLNINNFFKTSLQPYYQVIVVHQNVRFGTAYIVCWELLPNKSDL